jgi:deoxyribodipyrimidine photo-lyase
MSLAPVLLWFRHDLRLTDHAALDTAVRAQVPVIPVFILDDDAEGDWPYGSATKAWLHHSLQSLSRSLTEIGSRLLVFAGRTEEVLTQLASATGADRVLCQRRYEPAARDVEQRLSVKLAKQGISLEVHGGRLLFEPAEVQNKQGKPFQVFTPFWKHCQTRPAPEKPLKKPSRLRSPDDWPNAMDLGDLQLRPSIPWDAGFFEVWTPGEAGAAERLATLKRTVSDYKTGRNQPGQNGTSRLSPHLHFGEISPRQVWHAVHEWMASGIAEGASALTFLSEIGWREFAHHVLWHFPFTPKACLREDFRRFPWKTSAKALEAWQHGKTGYPIVDAGMRELWHTGWMHNRVRMIVGSFLTKDLMLNWAEGAKWFWDTLVDADLAQNTLNWQWVGGCGADAAPYFRVFNPVLQGKKFDPHGDYVRRWIPELSVVPAEYLHEPWAAPPEVLEDSGIVLGETYPAPLVDHFAARDAALAALGSIKK